MLTDDYDYLIIFNKYTNHAIRKTNFHRLAESCLMCILLTRTILSRLLLRFHVILRHELYETFQKTHCFYLYFLYKFI